MFLVNSWKEYIQIQQRHTIKTSIIATHAHAYIRVEAGRNNRLRYIIIATSGLFDEQQFEFKNTNINKSS